MTNHEIAKWTSTAGRTARQVVVSRGRLMPAALVLTAVSIAAGGAGSLGCVASDQGGELIGTSSSDLTLSKFHGWTEVPLGGFAGAPGAFATAVPAVAIRGGTGTFDLFTRGLDNAVWWTIASTSNDWATATFTNRTSLGGALLGMPAAVALSGMPGDPIAVVGRGTDYQAYAIVGTPIGGFGTWGQVSNGVLSDEPAVAWLFPYLYVFANGTDNGVYWSRKDVSGLGPPNDWTAWAGPIPNGVLTAQPAATVVGQTLYVVGRGTTNRYHVTKSTDLGSTWSAWTMLSTTTTFATGPAISAWLDGQLNVFGAAAADGHMLVSTSTDSGATWGAFQDVGGVLNTAPAAASFGSERIQTFGRGTDNNIYWNRYQ